MALALSAILLLSCGWLLVGLGWSRQAPLASDLLLRVCLSVGFGLGIFSAVFFLSLLFHFTRLMLVDLAVLALLLAGFFVLRTSTAITIVHGAEKEGNVPAWLHRALTAAFALVLFAALYAAIMRTLAHPHGDGWDAFSIWNLHARFLFRGGIHWRDGFTPLLPWSHPDYPLLLPAAVAHFWTHLGNDATAVPALISFLFTFSTAGLLYSALSILGGRVPAMLGGIALLSTPSFIEQGTSQYADVPLSFFILATIALLCLNDNREQNDPSHRYPGFLALAGLAAAGAAWTKNEGLLFLCAIVAARLVGVVRENSFGNWMARARQVVPLLAAMAPVLLLIAYFKHSIAPPGDLFSDPAATFHKLVDPARYWAIIKWYVKGFFRFGHWLLIPGTLVMIGFYFAAGKEADPKSQAGIRTSVLALILTLIGYFAVYLITPYDIYWHLRFSLTRLFLQVWPSSIFLFFLCIKNGNDMCGADTAVREFEP